MTTRNANVCFAAGLAFALSFLPGSAEKAAHARGLGAAHFSAPMMRAPAMRPAAPVVRAAPALRAAPPSAGSTPAAFSGRRAVVGHPAAVNAPRPLVRNAHVRRFGWPLGWGWGGGAAIYSNEPGGKTIVQPVQTNVVEGTVPAIMAVPGLTVVARPYVRGCDQEKVTVPARGGENVITIVRC